MAEMKQRCDDQKEDAGKEADEKEEWAGDVEDGADGEEKEICHWV